MKKILCIALIIGILTFVSSVSVFAKAEHEWRFGVPWSRELQNDSMQLFCDMVKFYSDGKMEIKLYPNGSLGTHDEIFHGVQDGSIEVGIFSPYVNLVPGGMLNWMPWTIESYDQSAVAFGSPDGILFKVMSKAWEEVGCHFLFVGLEGPYGIGNNVRPIKTPDDFKNLKMRVSSSLGFVKALQNMGAGTGMTVATIPWGDLYNALERNVVDGNWDLWSSLVEERHFEVLKYYTGLGWSWGTNNIVVNKDKWDALSADIQEAIIKAGKVAEIREYEVHRRADADFKKIIVDGGVEIYYPTSEERTMFKEKAGMPAIWDELCKPWLEKNYPGENMTQKVLDELKKIQDAY
ncbi:MAG: TRAP transporter substrate-binding protein [Candidatus Atribacteria bacterium]|nr:TRAP transporter substrate-binding protein [Candidatus Atribacteria bacterium]